MRLEQTLIVFAGAILGCAALVLAIMGLADKNIALGVIGVVGIIAVVVGTVVLYRQGMAVGRPAFDAALANDFTASDKGWYDASGLAIDHGRRVVLLGTATGVRRVPFGEIGAVTYSPTRAGPVAAGNSILSLILLPAAIGAVVHNVRKAGMHVAVGGETVRILGIQPKDAARWLRQLEDARTA